MAWYNTLYNALFRPATTKVSAVVSRQPDTVEKDTIQALPIRGGRAAGSVGPASITGQLGVEGIFLQRPLKDCDYDLIYHLGRYNHDVSFAKDNVVQLAKSDLKFAFDPSVSAAQAAAMITRCNMQLEKWYEGGSVSLINALFRQVYLFGCVSGEAQVEASTFSAVERVVLLSPKFLYFGWNRARDDWHPYQSGTVVNSADRIGYYNELNTITYKYIAYEAWSEDVPYSVPPVLSALRATCIEDGILENMTNIVKRLGLLGFLQVIVAAPSKGKNSQGKPETDAEYQARVQNYLTELEADAERGVSNGYMVGLKQVVDGKELTSEFKMTPSVSNPQGLVGLTELVISIKSAGLKQDPALLGKNFATTETLIVTLLRKFTHQLMNYQEIICQFLEHCFTLDLRLAGYAFKYIDISMEAPTLMDAQLEYGGLNEKRNYYKGLKADGIINQQQYAQAMGYEKPAFPEAPLPPGTVV